MAERKIDPAKHVEIARRYAAGDPLRAIASAYGVTRQAITNILRANGVPVRDLSVRRKCLRCGAELRVRRRDALESEHSYCDQACYVERIRDLSSGWVESRNGTRKARTLVREHFPLADGHVVHHENGDQSDNRLENLMVFGSHADHMRWHRGGFEKSGAVPLWRGDGRPLTGRIRAEVS